MDTNENALNQPKFELGIYGIIQDVFQGDYTIKQNLKIVGKKLIIFHGRGAGVGLLFHGKFHENNFIFLEPFPNLPKI